MKITLVLLLSLFAIHGHAERRGVQERIFSCQSDNDSSHLGKNKKFSLHIITNTRLKLTRLSDNKWIEAKASDGGYYLYGGTNGKGNLWATRVKGYMIDALERGEWVVAYPTSSNSYQNNRLSCQLDKVIRDFEPQTTTEIQLEEIGENANLGNGGYETKRIDLESLDLEKEKRALNKEQEGWEHCSWSSLEKRAEILEAIRKQTYDPDTADRIEKLQMDPGLLAMIALSSDNDISCSQLYVWLYTQDGYKMKLMYGHED